MVCEGVDGEVDEGVWLVGLSLEGDGAVVRWGVDPRRGESVGEGLVVDGGGVVAGGEAARLGVVEAADQLASVGHRGGWCCFSCSFACMECVMPCARLVYSALFLLGISVQGLVSDESMPFNLYVGSAVGGCI